MKYILKKSDNIDLIERIFENRNISFSNKEKFLNPTKEGIQHPLVYKNMDRAFKVFDRNLKLGEKILVLVDSDADGYCSAATMINFLNKSLKYNNVVYVMHEGKQHGLTEEMIKNIISNEPSLVIIPDAASNDYEGQKILFEHGIETIILDHHECKEYSSHAIIVNNQMNEKGNKTLSGAGMVLKFIEYVCEQYNLDHSAFYYDLVAIALVADGMYMIEEETRYYVLKGLENITNPFLKSLTGGVANGTFEYISFTLAPVINAIIRVGEMKDKKDLFDAMIGQNRLEKIKLRGKGEVDMLLSDYVIKMSERLKSKQYRDIKKTMADKGTTIITDGYPITFMLRDDDEGKTLNGLIASKLVDEYGKPALVLRRVQDEDGRVKYTGSGRSSKDFPLFRDYLLDTDKFIFCQGHQMAFGAAIDEKCLSEFLTSLINKKLPTNHIALEVDKAYTLGELSPIEIFEVDKLKQYWCKGFEKPLFYIKLTDVMPDDIFTMGAAKNTVKIKYNYIDYIKFKCSEEELEKLVNKKVKNIEIIGTFNVNEWNNKSYPQVFIENIKVTDKDVFEGIDFGKFNAFAI